MTARSNNCVASSEWYSSVRKNFYNCCIYGTGMLVIMVQMLSCLERFIFPRLLNAKLCLKLI